MTKRKLIYPIITLISMFILCFSGPLAAETVSQQLAKSNNDFALKLYDALNRDGKNLFFSPYSISTALAMTYAGAKGETKAEMAKVLEFHLPDDSLNKGFSQISSDLNAIKKQDDVELSVANALWIEKSFFLLPSYKKLMKQYYKSQLFTTDFRENSRGAGQRINKWVEKETKDKIKNLLNPNNLNAMTRLVLTNAIYFKGFWELPFNKRVTRKLPFWVSEKQNVKVPLMFVKDRFHYAETKDVKILEMPYKGGQLSLIAILPNKRAGINEIGNVIKKGKLLEITRQPQEVRVWFPKFKFSERYKLNEVLANLGMTKAFDMKDADFSGITGRKDLFISGIFHKAFIKVEEKGTEAAAATAVVMELKSAPPPTGKVKEFRADHPFFFCIQDNSTGSILFIGKVNRPTFAGKD